ncbi:MAG: hypothetical protein KDA37_15925 [Planctomycetales bacterium]|nr:hypothetical protein [Planctomycetales bacterium]
MSVDPYSLCPCGSGKKLKFCCSDLVADIEKIHRMVEGDQPRAALQHVEQTLKKRPGRPSLLDLKAMLELILHKLEDAEQTVAELLEKDPKNPAAHAQQAILKCAQGDGRAAVEPLQHALTMVSENMPRRVLEAIGAVGHTLLMEGNVIAARAHLWLYQGIAGKGDTRALELLVRLNQVTGLPLMLRDHLYMHEAPAGHPAEQQHSYAQALAAHGQWGPASAVFDKLCHEYPDLASLEYNRALVHGWLGDLETFAAGLHEFARRDVPLDDAVEAESIAQVLDPGIEDPTLDILRLIYPVLDEEEMFARLSLDQRFASQPVDTEEFADMEAPKPRAGFLLLDRPLPESGVDITRDTAPRILGVMYYFGRQTNRSERLELVIDRNEQYDESRGSFEQKLQGVVGIAEEEVVDQVSSADQALRWRWHFPRDTPIERRRALSREEGRVAILQRWPDTPLAVLGGKTPRQAASDPAMRIALMAAVATLEQGASNHRFPDAFRSLRDSLVLPQPEPIDAASIDPTRLPLTRLSRLDASRLSDEDLKELYQRAAMAGASGPIKQLAEEIVKRPAFDDFHGIEQATQRLAMLQEDTASASRVYELARERCERRGESNVEWDLCELELSLIEGQPESVQQLLRHIEQEHIHEQGVSEQLYSLFYQLGIVPGADEAPEAPSPPPTEPSGIWTPESAQGESGKQKLWLPS